MKKQVHYALLNDMRNFMPNFNADDYVSYVGDTDRTVVEEVREYYDKNLPIPLLPWLRVNIPDKNLTYSEKFKEQMFLVGRTIWKMIKSVDNETNGQPDVCGFHYSKSIKLPVFQIKLKKNNTTIWLRSDFHTWIVSVKSDKPIDCDFMDLFEPDVSISDIYFEGLNPDMVFGSYKDNHSKFSIEILSNYDLYTFFFLLKNYLNKI